MIITNLLYLLKTRRQVRKQVVLWVAVKDFKRVVDIDELHE